MHKLSLHKFFFYFCSPIFLIILYFLNFFVSIKLFIIPAHRIGHLGWEVEIYLSKRKKLKEKSIDIFCYTELISNKFLANKWKEKIFVLPSYFIFPIIRLNRAICKFANLNKNYIELSINVAEHNLYIDDEIKIEFTQKEIEYAEKILKENGVLDTNKIVCLMVRDGKYLKNKMNLEPENYSYRDVDVDSYLELVQFLIKKGFYVIRMGVIIEKKLNYQNEKYFEFSESKFFSELMDVYLSYKCRFAISTGTGWEVMPAFIFKKPMLFTNFIPYLGAFTSFKNFFFLFKKYKLKKENISLDLNEIFDLEIKLETNNFDLSLINFEDNNKYELLFAVENFLKYLDCGFYEENKKEKIIKLLYYKYSNMIDVSNLKMAILKHYNIKSRFVFFE